MPSSVSTEMYFVHLAVSIPVRWEISFSFAAPLAMAVMMELYVAGSRSSCFSRFSGPAGIRSVLELGCGTGNITIELAKRGYDMTALDSSDEMLSIADRNGWVYNAGRTIFHTGDGNIVSWTGAGSSLCFELNSSVYSDLFGMISSTSLQITELSSYVGDHYQQLLSVYRSSW